MTENKSRHESRSFFRILLFLSFC